jgi:hypothetical protein
MTGEHYQAERRLMGDTARLWMVIMPLVIATLAFGWAALSKLL